MAHIKIVRTSDYSDCETCGGGFDDGGSIFIDGELIWSKIPQGSCYGGEYLEVEFFYKKALEHLGHTVEADYE